MSKNVIDGFRELRKFCKDAALMLGTAAGMMEEADWERCKPWSAIDVGRRMAEPERWLPSEVCRFFKHSGYPQLLAFISVVLDDDAEDFSPAQEALASAGCIIFKPGERPDHAEHWWSRWHVYQQNGRMDNGTLCSDEPHTTWDEEDHDDLPAGIMSVTTFAIPLLEVTDCNALRERIVKPLLNLIEQQPKGGKGKGK